MKKRSLKKNNGFALLFSVLISSFLLTIGLSIFSIALRELSISTATRQSVHAFFAADSGREYVIYRDLKVGDLFDTDTLPVGTPATQTFTGTVIADGLPNYTTTIYKNWIDNSKNQIETRVISRGYDTDAEDKVERAIEQTY